MRIVTWLMLFASIQVATPQRPPSPKPTAKKPTVSAAVMSPATVAAIQALVKENGYRAFYGVSDLGSGSMKLWIMSSRTFLALKFQEVQESGGRYTPPASMRRDIVTVDCGDSDIGEIFHCVRVRVRLPSGQIAKPLSYKAGTNQYRNALGARWSVREVEATYTVSALRDGFSVDYADGEGGEWTQEVTADDAAKELLLRLETDEPFGPVAVSASGYGDRRR